MQVTLCAARKNAKLTQKEVAKIIGVSSKTISGWETGKHKLKVDALIAMADLYNAPIDDIILPDSLPKK